MISKVEGVQHLKHLQRLSLGHNCISNLDGSGLECLPNLMYLTLDNNRISSLAGLHKVQGLVELYLANNRIETLREVFYLKVRVYFLHTPWPCSCASCMRLGFLSWFHL